MGKRKGELEEKKEKNEKGKISFFYIEKKIYF